MKVIGFSSKENFENTNKNEIRKPENEPQNENVRETNNTASNENEIIRKSTRERKQTKFYRPENFAYCIYVNFVSANTPKTYDEAMKSNESRQWQNAMEKEINCLNKNETYELVELPKDKRVIDLKWVLLRKRIMNIKLEL